MKHITPRRTAQHLALDFVRRRTHRHPFHSGCGGGSNSVLPVAVAVSTFNLGNGQSAKLDLGELGSTLNGTIIIANLPVSSTEKTTRALNFQIPPCMYPVSGTVTGSGGFQINGTFPTPVGSFNLTGTLPTQSSAGSFNLSANGQSVSGAIPSLSSVVSTTGPTTGATTAATARPTTSPTATAGVSRLGNVLFSAKSGFNGVGFIGTLPLKVTRNFTFSNATSFGLNFAECGVNNIFFFEGPNLNRPARMGDTFLPGNQSAATGILSYNEPGNKGWESTNGTMTITAASATSVSLTLEKVTFARRSFGTTTATGTFTVNANGVFKS